MTVRRFPFRGTEVGKYGKETRTISPRLERVVDGVVGVVPEVDALLSGLQPAQCFANIAEFLVGEHRIDFAWRRVRCDPGVTPEGRNGRDGEIRAESRREPRAGLKTSGRPDANEVRKWSGRGDSNSRSLDPQSVDGACRFGLIRVFPQ